VPFDLVWFSAFNPGTLPDRIHLRIARDQMFVAFASRSNQLQIGWFVHKGKYARLRARPFAETVSHIAAHVPVQLDRTVRQALKGWHDLSLLPAVSQVAETWSQPGLLLLGDAAHPMSPSMGQGINVAIYDAVAAAQRLVPAFAAGASLDEAARNREATAPRHRCDAADSKYHYRHHVRARPECDAEVRERPDRPWRAYAVVAGMHEKGGGPPVMGRPASTRESRAMGTRRQQIGIQVSARRATNQAT
jgi:2-polyprenyl-6-methoxyphenol hydroxylase-like FAD-dependent oxidoreductase